MTFDQVKDVDIIFSGAPVLSRTPDTALLDALFAPGTSFDEQTDDINRYFPLRIPSLRHSGPHWKNVQYSEDEKRANDMVEAHHARFSQFSSAPSKVKSVRHMLREIESDSGCWVPYIREPGSSTKAIFEGDGAEVRRLLRAANELARFADSDTGRALHIFQMGRH